MSEPNLPSLRPRPTAALIWAAALSLAFALLIVASGPDRSGAAAGTYYEYGFGARDLKLGDRGEDVKTLNWLLRSQAIYAPAHGDFVGTTDRGVRRIQSAAGVKANGVVRRDTRKAFARRMPAHRATWYGPGFWGNTTACGKTLTKKTVGVAHRKLPCGTRVTFAYKGRWVRAKVIDRGPYRFGYRWDLTQRLAKRLGALQAGTVTLKAAAGP